MIALWSGGQTGADRAALDVALALGMDHGGWCPAGRRAEDGPIPDVYQLQETEVSEYPERTRRNIRDTDATLLFTDSRSEDRGCGFTLRTTLSLSKPRRVIPLDHYDDRQAVALIREWLAHMPELRRLNVAGPRESRAPGTYERVRAILQSVFEPAS